MCDFLSPAPRLSEGLGGGQGRQGLGGVGAGRDGFVASLSVQCPSEISVQYPRPQPLTMCFLCDCDSWTWTWTVATVTVKATNAP